MLWLKAWLETRWKMVWMVLMSVLAFGMPLEVALIRQQQQLMLVLLPVSLVLCFITAITLAGSGIQTASVRPGGSEKGGEGSTLFTLSLPVTRVRLFAVRTVTGVLETVALLTLFNFVIWLLVPKLATNADVGLGYFAVIVSSSLAVYAISACLSTFCDEGWRYNGSVLIVGLLFMLTMARPASAVPRHLPRYPRDIATGRATDPLGGNCYALHSSAFVLRGCFVDYPKARLLATSRFTQRVGILNAVITHE
jgi:hypothetical protein